MEEALPPKKERTNMSVRWQDYIEERKDVMLGKPVFAGTRLTVEHILRELGTGITPTFWRTKSPFTSNRTRPLPRTRILASWSSGTA